MFLYIIEMERETVVFRPTAAAVAEYPQLSPTSVVPYSPTDDGEDDDELAKTIIKHHADSVAKVAYDHCKLQASPMQAAIDYCRGQAPPKQLYLTDDMTVQPENLASSSSTGTAVASSSSTAVDANIAVPKVVAKARPKRKNRSGAAKETIRKNKGKDAAALVGLVGDPGFR